MDKKRIILLSIIIIIAVAALVFGIKMIEYKKAQQEAILKQQSERQIQDNQTSNQTVDAQQVQAELKKLEDMQSQQGTPTTIDEKAAQAELDKLKQVQEQQKTPEITQQAIQEQLKQLEALQKAGK